MANKRAQFFTFEIYEDSAPKNWQEILKDYHVAMYLSKHDKDEKVDEETGEITPKKKHWHILVMFDGLKGLDILDELIAMVKGVKPPLHKYIVQSKRGMARYLTHMDDPDKYPYYLDPEHKVIAIGGAEDYNELCKGAAETRQAETEMTKDIQDYCRKKKIRNLATFTHLCNHVGNDEWGYAMRQNSYYWNSWFSALRREDPRELEKVEEIIARNTTTEGEEKNESND